MADVIKVMVVVMKTMVLLTVLDVVMKEMIGGRFDDSDGDDWWSLG